MSPTFKYAFAAMCSALFIGGCSTTSHLGANPHSVDVYAVSATGVGAKIGMINLSDTANGLLIETYLKHLPSGSRGFHIHENGSCEPLDKDGKAVAALAAGGHFNPEKSPHGTPLSGHLGDLPVLEVNAQGVAQHKLIAPRLKVSDIKGRAIMIHAGGDNHSDHPLPLGGGGDRIACGVI